MILHGYVSVHVYLHNMKLTCANYNYSNNFPCLMVCFFKHFCQSLKIRASTKYYVSVTTISF